MGQFQHYNVYVRNLPWDVKWQDLKDHMRRAGEVIRADVIMDENGRSKGWGIVEYANAQSAERAIRELNESKLFNRIIFVREDREEYDNGSYPRRDNYDYPYQRNRFNNGRYGNFGSSRGYSRYPQQPRSHRSKDGRQVLVTNLPTRVTWQDVKDVFSGTLKRPVKVDILVDDRNRSKGVATALFDDEEDARLAIKELDGSDFYGRTIHIQAYD